MKDPESTQLLAEIATSSQNDLIHFFVVAIVAMVVVLIPVYGMILSDRKERRKSQQLKEAAESHAESERLDRYIQREQQIMQVIKENSEVIAGLKVTLETSGNTTLRAIDRIQERIDGIYKETDKINNELAVINNLFNKNNA